MTIAEFATGIVLNLNGSRHLGDGPLGQPFDSQEDAFQFAEQYTGAHPDHECTVTDESGCELALFRPPLTHKSREVKDKPRWKFR